MDKLATCVGIFIIIGHTDILKAELTIIGANITTTNTAALNRELIIGFTDGEIDGIELEWDPFKTRHFDYYYKVGISLDEGEVFYKVTIEWNEARTLDERKRGSGQFVAKAMLGNTLVKNFKRTIDIEWKPEATSLTLRHDGDYIIRDTMLTLTCTYKDIGKPEGNLMWKINNTDMAGGIYTEDVITFSQVKSAHDGTWECYLKNEIDSGETSSKTVEVKWKPGPSTLTQNPASDYVMRYTKLTLECTCTDKGRSTGEVKWIPSADPVTGVVYNISVITINVTEEHDREWTCYFENEVKMGASDSTTVVVTWPPQKARITADPNVANDIVKRGQKVELECKGDPGKPSQKVLWKSNSTVLRLINVTKRNILNIEPRDNGTWSCLFINEFGNGTESESVSIYVSMTPLKPAITLINSTAASLSSSITPDAESELVDYNYMNITLEGKNMAFSKLQPVNVSEYTFHNLEPATSYNISVFYNNELGDGAPALETYNTKPSPILKQPVIKRNVFSLDAMVEIEIENPDSAGEIQISVCSIGETDDSNCNTETITEITSYFSEGIYASLSARLVNVSVYDKGVQVYTHGDKIGLAAGVIALVVLAGIVLVVVIVVIIAVVIKKKDSNKNKQGKEEEENIDPYSYSNPNNESRTGTGHVKVDQAEYSPASKPRKLPKLDNADPPVYSVANKGKPLAPIVASPADGPVYSKVDWSKKNSRQSLKGSPMSKKAIDKIIFAKNDGKINIQFEVSTKFTGDIEIGVCREGEESPKRRVSKQHVRGTKNVVMILPMEETSQDKYGINMKFIVKGQMVQEVDLSYPYEQNAVHVTVMNDAYVTSGTDVKASEMPEYSEVNKSKKTKGSEMPIYSEVNKPKKKKKAAEEQPYEDVETKNQSSHNERSTNAVSPSNAEVAVEGVPPHPPRKGAPKEGVMYAELDLNNSGPPRLLPRLGSKSPAQEPVVYADVRPG